MVQARIPQHLQPILLPPQTLLSSQILPNRLRVDNLIRLRQHHPDRSASIQILFPHYALVPKEMPPQRPCDVRITTGEIPQLPFIRAFRGSVEEVVCDRWVVQEERDWVDEEGRGDLL